MKKIIIAAVAVLGAAGNVFAAQGVSIRRSGVRSGSVVCKRFEPGTKFDFKCWASEGFADGRRDQRVRLSALELAWNATRVGGTAIAVAACLEVAVGESYEKYLRRKVLDPLGMKDTTFWPNEDQFKRLMKPYTSDDGKIRLATDYCSAQLAFPKKHEIFPAASAGLFSTPRDMIRFSQMLAHHGEWKGKTVVSRKTFDGLFAVKQTPASVESPYTCGAWIYGDWIGHEGAMRTDQRANLRTGHARVFFIQTANAAGSAFFQLKRDWHAAADRIQGTAYTKFGN